MGKVRDFFLGQDARFDASGVTGSDMDAEALPADIPPAFYGLNSYADGVAPAPKVSRRLAIQVPSVKRSRDLVPGVLGTLPIEVTDGAKVAQDWFLSQPEHGVPRSITYGRLFEDLFFEEIAWWEVITRGWHGFPTSVKRVAPSRINVVLETGKVYLDGKEVTDPDRRLIRFDAPTDGLLVAGARAILTCLLLDAAAGRNADGVPPMDYFSPGEFNTLDNDEIKEVLNDWRDARRERATGYVPADLRYNSGGWNPQQLQMAEARNHAVIQIANVAGVDPEDLGVSTTSRTYANQFDRRKDKIDFTLGLWRQAVEDRLSMNDLTPRGWTTTFNLSAFLRSDDKTRMETYEIGKRVGAWLDDEIREAEGKPALTPAQKAETKPARPALTVVPNEPLSASGDLGPTFDGEPAVRFAAEGVEVAAVDVERRTISGRVVPYGVVGFANGAAWVFSQGTVRYSDPKRVKLWIQHDKNRVVGYGLAFEDRPDGLYATFQVEDGPEGDEALRKADPDGSATWDAFSIGLRQGGRFRTVNGINYAIEAPLMETSLTPAPSFEDARVHHVAASATTTGENTMTEEQRARLAALRAQQTLTADEQAEKARLEALETAHGGEPVLAAAQFSAETMAAFGQAFAQALQAAGGLPAPEHQPAAGGAQFEVNEAPLYRFDGIQGQASLSMDMQAASGGDSEARQRIDQFFNSEQFAVTTANVASLNPTQNRPDLYVPNLSYSTPLWDSVTQGHLDDKTPFTIPKFGSSGGLINTHTEGVEPSPGNFSATVQTVTPGPISGKIEIVREVLDQGGSPQADQVIWNEMVNGWLEAREARIAAILNAVTTTEVNLASAVDVALVAAVTNIFTGLQFVRGGNRFTKFVSDGMLYPALVNAKDGNGRNLLPIFAPTNAQGETSGGFDRIRFGSQEIRAAWALGATPASRSYLFVPTSVYAWASAPRRFEFQYQLKSVDVGIWGYGAEAVTRMSDVRPIDYTTADV